MSHCKLAAMPAPFSAPSALHTLSVRNCHPYTWFLFTQTQTHNQYVLSYTNIHVCVYVCVVCTCACVSVCVSVCACTYNHMVQWGIHLNPCLPCLGGSCQVVKFIPHPFREVGRDRPCSCVRTVHTHRSIRCASQNTETVIQTFWQPTAAFISE